MKDDIDVATYSYQQIFCYSHMSSATFVTYYPWFKPRKGKNKIIRIFIQKLRVHYTPVRVIGLHELYGSSLRSNLSERPMHVVQ